MRSLFDSSCPALGRASTTFLSKQDVDARDKRGHDVESELPFTRILLISPLWLRTFQRHDRAVDHRAELGVVGGANRGPLNEDDPDELLGTVEEVARTGDAAPEHVTD